MAVSLAKKGDDRIMYVVLIRIWELAEQSTRGSVCDHQSYLRSLFYSLLLRPVSSLP